MQEKLMWSPANGITMTHMQEKKFKTSVLSVTFSVPLGEKNAYASLLPNVLIRGTENYDDFSLISKKLDSLYGARIFPIIRKSGANLAFGFIADVIDERFADDNLTEQVIKLISELIKNPAMESGLLKDEYIQSEKQNLIDRISRLKSDTRSYVVRRMKEIMHENEPFGLCEYGTVSGVKEITSKSLTEYFKSVLSSAPMQFFYCGSLDRNSIEQMILSEFSNRNCKPVSLDKNVLSAPETPKNITEKMPVSQGKLAMGFRSGILLDSEYYPAFMLFSCMLGGYTGSRLFRHVREKLSLCYYASAGIDKYTGCLTATSGVDTKNSELVQKEVLLQIDDMKNGNIDQNELNSAKTNILDSLKSMYDSPASLENFFQSGAMNGVCLSLKELYESISNVSIDDIIFVANKIKLDTVYFIQGGDKNEA